VDQSLEEVDAALIMLNAAETLGGGDRYIVAAAAASGTPAVVALNKCDAIAAESLIRAQAEAQALAGDLPVLAVSALRGDNVEQLLDVVIETLPTGPQYFPDESVSDQPLEILIAELVREQVLRRTRDEVPHAVAVRVEEIVERKDRPLVEIEATVVVETESQKAIVIGKGGALIKQIGSAARHEIEAVVGARVFLSLRVKVRRKWRRDSSSVERFV
jgi:GTP-binding protein Era